MDDVRVNSITVYGIGGEEKVGGAGDVDVKPGGEPCAGGFHGGVDRAARRAAARFWVLPYYKILYSMALFLVIGIQVSFRRHPFVGMSPDGGLVLNLPAHYTLPDAVHD